MRTRYALDPNSGLLVDRNGESLGRVVSLTLDDRPMGGYGGAVGVGELTASPSPRTKEQGGGVGEASRSQLESQAVERIWLHWIEVSGKNQRLDEKRKRIIRSALTTVRAADRCDLETAEAKVSRALLGLSLSPFHRGENDTRRQYMEIRYALKGRGDESDDERIEKACDWAMVYAPGRQSTLDPDKAIRYLEDVRIYVARLSRDPKAVTGRQQAVDAFNRLRAGGYEVERLDRAPWARFSS